MNINDFKNIIKKGFAHILGANVLIKLFVFFTSFILVRILSVHEYGVWSYAQNIIRLIMLAQGLGSNVGVLQFTTRSVNKYQQKEYLKLGNRLNLIVNAVIIVFFYTFFTFNNLEIVESTVIVKHLLFALIMIGLHSNYLSYFRGTLQHKLYSVVLTVQAVSFSVLAIVLGYLFRIVGLEVAFITSYAIGYATALILDKNSSANVNSKGKIDFKRFVNFSLLSTATNIVSQALYLIDIFLIGLILSDSVLVATYKTSTMIPTNLTFISISIMIFVYPYIAKNSDNIEYVKRNYLKLIKTLVSTNLVIVIGLIVFAPTVINLLFTKRYIGSIPAFRVLMIGYFFAATFRIPAGNTLAALHKVNINLVITMICGVVNIVLDYLLIKKYGIIGAAYATTSIFILNAIISNIYLLHYIRSRTDQK
jgi:O-antigen/teichoic acid export membrane protein